MKKISILVDGHVFDGEYQGSRTFLRGLYKKLASDDRFRIAIACNNPEILEQEFEESLHNITPVKLNSKNRYMRLAYEFPKIIAKGSYDYSHFQYIQPPIKIGKTIVTTHDVLFAEFPHFFPASYRSKYLLFKWSARHSNILTTDSKFSAETIRREFNISTEKIHILNPGLDKTSFRKCIPERAGDFLSRFLRSYPFSKYAICVSRVEPRKNQETLVSAYTESRMWEKGIGLIFVGDTTIANDQFDRAVSNLPEDARGYLVVLPRLDQEELELALQCALFSVYPSRAEGFGYPPLESVMLGTEVLASNSTSLAEFDFFGDRFFSPDDIAGLAKKMELLAGGEKLEPSLAQIHSEILNRYSWDQIAERFSDLVLSDSVL